MSSWGPPLRKYLGVAAAAEVVLDIFTDWITRIFTEKGAVPGPWYPPTDADNLADSVFLFF